MLWIWKRLKFCCFIFIVCKCFEFGKVQNFVVFPQCFQKASFPKVSKGVIVWEWVKGEITAYQLFAPFPTIFFTLYQQKVCMQIHWKPLSKNSRFSWPRETKPLKTLWEQEKLTVSSISYSPFLTLFSILIETTYNFWAKFIQSSANAFSLDQSYTRAVGECDLIPPPVLWQKQAK